LADLPHEHLEYVIASACRVAGGADVRSVHIIGGRRLTSPELLRLHERAAASGVQLAMDGEWVVTLCGRHRQDGCQRDVCRARGLLFLPRLLFQHRDPIATQSSRRGQRR